MPESHQNLPGLQQSSGAGPVMLLLPLSQTLPLAFFVLRDCRPISPLPKTILPEYLKMMLPLNLTSPGCHSTATLALSCVPAYVSA